MTTSTFAYTVIDKTGQRVSGSLDAESPAAVARKLKTMGYAPISISEKNSGMQKELSIPGFGNKVKLKELAVFARQFSTMVSSGLSLLRGLNILVEQTESKPLKIALTEVRNDVEQGASLSGAMAKHPKVFPPLMVNMTKAGEVGGFLDQVMKEIARNYEAEVKLKSKVKSAMTYPIVVLIIAFLAVIGMLIFIVPTFAGLFKSLGGTLPLPTRILVFLSNEMKFILPLIIVVGIGGKIVWGRIKRDEKVRNFVDPIKLKLPVFGNLFQKIALSRFTRNLSTMMSAGVPILQALDIVADTTGNIVVTNAVRDVQQSVRTGESLTAPLSKHDVFPDMVVQMLTVGEETGALDSMLAKISEFYDDEVEATTESLTALLEPVMIAFLGAIIGSMIVALYMPIFKIFTLIND